MTSFFFSGWEPIARILVVGTLGYLALVVLLRVSGKRTLAQLNSFDFVITVAIGAAFGRVLTANRTPLAEALTAFALLVVLQYLVTSIQIRSPRLCKVIATPPALLYYRGQVMHDELRRQRLTESELHTAARKHGLGSLTEAEAVVMEGDGEVAVVAIARAGDGDALEEAIDPERAEASTGTSDT